eukprot:198848-Chlamydomonas_euryale.AAC.4
MGTEGTRTPKHATKGKHTSTLSSRSTHVLEHVQADPAAAVREEHVGVAVEEICHQPNGWRGYGVVRRELEVQVHHHALPAAYEVWQAVWECVSRG